MKDHTDITVLLDRSGSMEQIKDDTIGGFNQFLVAQQEAGANASLTLVQFNSESIDDVCVAMPVRDVEKLTGETFVPRAMTPLLDALGSTIVKAGERLASLNEAERPDKVVFVILTDGLENASKEYSKAAIKSLIEQQNHDYNWQFVYLGANQDAFHEAGGIGISQHWAAGYATANVNAVYANVASNVARYRGTGQSVDLHWSDEQRKQMTDKDASKS